MAASQRSPCTRGPSGHTRFPLHFPSPANLFCSVVIVQTSKREESLDVPTWYDVFFQKQAPECRWSRLLYCLMLIAFICKRNFGQTAETVSKRTSVITYVMISLQTSSSMTTSGKNWLCPSTIFRFTRKFSSVDATRSADLSKPFVMHCMV